MTPHEDWVIEKWFDGLPIHRRGELAGDDIHSLKMKIAIAIRVAQAEQRTKDAEIARSGWKKMNKHFHSPHTVCREIADAIAQEDK